MAGQIMPRHYIRQAAPSVGTVMNYYPKGQSYMGFDDNYYGHRSRDVRHQARRTNSNRLTYIKVLGIVGGILALLAIVVTPIALTYSKKPEIEPVCHIVNYDASIRFPTMSFSESLNDASSQEYEVLSKKFCNDLSAGLEKEMSINECGKDRADTCSVSKFMEGSKSINYNFKQFLRKTEREVDLIEDNMNQIESDLHQAIENVAYKGQTGLDRANIFSQYPTDQISVFMKDVQPVIECPLTIPTNGEIIGSALNPKYSGDKITIQCDLGHRLPDGEFTTTLTCGLLGAWDSVIEPCVVQTCPNITTTEHREFLEGHPEGNTYGSTVVTQCEDGYTTDLEDRSDDVTILHCLEDGTWNQELPKCQRFQIDGNWGQWAEWPGNCSMCDGSIIERTRECNDPAPQFGGASCEGDSLETDQCEIDKSCVAVIAALSDTLSAVSRNEDVVFDVEKLDKTNAFDGTYFTAHKTGLFFFTLTIGSKPESESAELKLVNEAGTPLATVNIGPIPNLELNYTNAISRDVIIELNGNSKVKVVLMQGGIAAGISDRDGEYLTSVSIFSYSGLMKDEGVAYTYGLEQDRSIANTADSIFKGVSPQVDLGTGYSPATGTFTAPKQGLYLFSLTVLGVPDGMSSFSVNLTAESLGMDLNDYIFEEFTQAEMIGLRSNSFPNVTFSRALLVELAQGETVDVYPSIPGANIYQGSDGLDTSMSMFLYEPRAVEPVAFRAVAFGYVFTVDWAWSPFIFDSVPVNIGGDFVRNSFLCRVPGIYYFYAMVELPGMDSFIDSGDDAIGLPELFAYSIQITYTIPIEVALMKNEEVMGTMSRTNYQLPVENEISRSFLVELKAGDVVHVERYIAFSNFGFRDPIGSFTGLLVQ